MEGRDFRSTNRGKSAVMQGTGEGIFAETRMNVLRLEGANATTQLGFPILPGFFMPSHEQGV